MKMPHALATTLALLLATSSALAAGLDTQEAQVVANVKRLTPDALKLLERSVLVNSGTLNPAGVREVGDIYRREFDALGFKTRWVDMPAGMRRAGHLVAERSGDQMAGACC